jgi:pimeloyl-ACP methyl ester carboxylesterase
MRIPRLALATLLAACGDQSMGPTWVSGPTGALAVDDGGPPSGQAAGRPVLFVHSLAGNSGHWARQFKHLRQDRRALALDLRGHGRSEPPKNGDYTIEGMAGDIAAVVDTLGLDRFILVGHSMGGGVALTYAGAHPERVTGLVLVDPIGDGKQITAAEAEAFLGGLESDYENTIRKYWTSIAGPDTTIREHLLADLRATPRNAVLQSLRSVMRFDPSPALARYQGPKLSIVTPQNNKAFSLHRLGNGFPYRVIQGTGHWIHLDRPEEFNRTLDEFLEKRERDEDKRKR